MTSAPAERELLAHRAVVQRFVRRLTGDEVEAADLTQETMVEALRHVDQWRGGRGWLLAIARNKVRAARRTEREAPEEPQTLEALGLEAGWGAPMDPEALNAQLEERRLLEQAMASLSDDAREILTLRELEGLSGDETAQALGLTLAAMKSRLHRARLALAACVREEMGHAAR